MAERPLDSVSHLSRVSAVGTAHARPQGSLAGKQLLIDPGLLWSRWPAWQQ